MLISRRKDASQADPDAGLKPRIELAERDGVHHAVLRGNWTTRRVAAIDPTIRQIEKNKAIKSLHVDLAGVGRIDTAGAWLVERLLSAMRSRGVRAGRVRARSDAARDPAERRRGSGDARWRFAARAAPRLRASLPRGLGRQMYAIAGDFKASMYILGATIRGSQMKAGRGHGVNIAAIVNQIDRMGVGALPVVRA